MTNSNVKDKKCAPSNSFSGNSCISKKTLISIAERYNSLNTDKIDTSLNKKDLVKKLEDKLGSSCQRCWIISGVLQNKIQLNDDDKLLQDLKKFTWLPDGPKKKYEWLSTTHINDKLLQYHKVDKQFLFLGAVPLDFDLLPVLGIRDINFVDLHNKKNKNKIGVVFNLDKHDMHGSHWVAVYADLVKGKINYFDSNGSVPPKEIKKFINKLTKASYNIIFGEKLSINDVLKAYKNKESLPKKVKENLDKMDFRFNTIRHQFKNSECGVYCLHFIIESLKGRTFDDITNNIIDDDDMNKNREKYFI